MSNIKLFESQKIRSIWDAEQEKWYFSVIDVIQILTDSSNPRRYWSDLKRKLELEGFAQLYEIIVQLKMVSPDGKKYITDCSDTEGLLRIIQSIPSPKAEPFKQWLAKVGYERIEETQDPWSGNTVKEYKQLKGLKKENLRDNMTNLELVLNMLAEATTTEISKEKKPVTFDESKEVAKQGGTIAGNTRKEIEEKTGKKIISSQNAKALKSSPGNKKLK
jgi:hypothetical protein